MIRKIDSLMTDALAAGVKLERVLRENGTGKVFDTEVAAARAPFEEAVEALPRSLDEVQRTTVPVEELIADCEFLAAAVLVALCLRRLAAARAARAGCAPPSEPEPAAPSTASVA